METYFLPIWGKFEQNSLNQVLTVAQWVGKVWTWSSSILLLSLFSISGVYLTCIYVRILQVTHTYTDQRKMTAKMGVSNCKMKIK